MKGRFFPEAFAIAFCIAYVAVLALDLPLFLYYPQAKVFRWAWEPLSGVGPRIVWYGLLAYALPIAAIASTVVPSRLFTPGARNWLWLFPAGAMVGTAYLMSHFFIA